MILFSENVIAVELIANSVHPESRVLDLLL